MKNNNNNQKDNFLKLIWYQDKKFKDVQEDNKFPHNIDTNQEILLI